MIILSKWINLDIIHSLSFCKPRNTRKNTQTGRYIIFAIFRGLTNLGYKLYPVLSTYLKQLSTGLAIGCLVLLTIEVNAQVKYEKEDRISINKVPASAKRFVDSLNFDRKVKWYREEGFNRISIEAKTTFNSRRYSIEFDKHGNLEDIEYQVSWKEIPPPTKTEIVQYFDNIYQKFKIQKVQVQLTGDETKLIQEIRQKRYIGKHQVYVNWEIVINAKTNDRYQMLEYLFNDEGGMLKNL